MVTYLHQQGYEYLILGAGIAHRLSIEPDISYPVAFICPGETKWLTDNYSKTTG